VKAALADHVPAFGDAMIAIVPDTAMPAGGRV
jgi:hypothetical protein